MPTSFEEIPTAVDMNRRFARLAVSWYGVDADRVEEILREVLNRRARGEDVHILEALLDAEVLNAGQAENLRIGLAPTQIQVVVPLADGKRDRMAATADIVVPLVEGATLNNEPMQMGPYRILRRLGVGGMGAVYLAFEKKENRQVAVKVLSAEHAPVPSIQRRFQLEGQHGALLQHPNIVRTFDTGQDSASGLHYIVLEYVEGPTAHELLDQKGKLEVGDAVHIVLDIARALEHAHKRQIIHRDIKPGNILLAPSGLAKLTDFGLAKRQGDANNLTHHSQGIGTPYYMPYEQAMNAKMADERSDIYALGATLYHLVAGEVPFSGESSLEIVEKKGLGTYPPACSFNPEVPHALEEIIARMLRRDPDDRYQTISEVIVDLDRSQLAAPIPGFVTLASALQDPVMLQRITAPIEATQPDLRLKQALEAKQATQPTWLVRYRDQRGNLCKLKATAADIITRLEAGTIPLDAGAAHAGKAGGKFKTLARWPQFQKTIETLRRTKSSVKRKTKSTAQSTAPVAVNRRRTWLLLAAGVLGIVTILLATAFFLARAV